MFILAQVYWLSKIRIPQDATGLFHLLTLVLSFIIMLKFIKNVPQGDALLLLNWKQNKIKCISGCTAWSETGSTRTKCARIFRIKPQTPKEDVHCCTCPAIIAWASVKNMIIPRKVPNVESNFKIRCWTLMHWGKVKMDKLGSFISEEAYTIPI